MYLVADFVEVRTKSNSEDTQWIWQSKADGNFAISEDTEGEAIGRGTEIKIYLKEEAQEYLDEGKLKDLVEKYSEFINFPIYMWESKEESEEVPIEEDDEEKSDEEKDEEDDDEDDEETTTMRTTTTTMRTKDDKPKRKRLRKPSGTGSYSTTLKLSGSDRLPKLNRKSTPSFTRRCRRQERSVDVLPLQSRRRC